MEELPMNVQAYILTITYHTSFEEIIESVMDCGRDVISNFLKVKRADKVSYVSPKWATDGDIIFFYYAKSSINSIRKLKRKLYEFDDDEERCAMKKILDSAEEIYKIIGGCIFAVGKVCGNAEIGERYKHSHFKNNIFAPITDFVNLETVISIEWFSEYLSLEFKKSITPVLGESFDRLKNDILEDDYIDYLANAHSVPVPLKDISKDDWLSLTMNYRRKFFLEIQFRKYYVDYFFACFGDYKEFYTECICFRGGRRMGIADNFIMFNKKYIAVEVKLNINTVYNFKGQLEKYCDTDRVKLSDNKMASKDEIVQNHVIVIDVNGFYIYNHKRKEIRLIENLDNIKSTSDIKKLREKCIKTIK